MSAPPSIPFLDLRRQHLALAQNLQRALERVLHRGRLILGEEVQKLETTLSERLGLPYAIGVASGTDAITLSLQTLDLSPGAKVATTALAPPPVAVAIERAGAVPFFVDVRSDDLQIDVDALSAAKDDRIEAVLAIHLYGTMADTCALSEVCTKRGWALVEDGSQAIDAKKGTTRLGDHGNATTLSFYPTKNLGALGDGGMILSHDPKMPARWRHLRDYGRIDAGSVTEVGLNSRLDELQAAFLLEKLPHLDTWTKRRHSIAARYRVAMQGDSVRPLPEQDGQVHHLFVVRCRDRQAFQDHLRARGIGWAIHYPSPLHRQPAWEDRELTLPHTEKACGDILSLPLDPFLEDAEVDRIVEALETYP